MIVAARRTVVFVLSLVGTLIACHDAAAPQGDGDSSKSGTGPPPSSAPGLVRQCTGTNALNHTPSTHFVTTLTALDSTLINATASTSLMTPASSQFVAVLPPKYGSVVIGSIIRLDYTPAKNCVGVDTVWYVVQSAGVRDTFPLQIRVVTPDLGVSDSLPVVSGQTVVLYATNRYAIFGSTFSEYSAVGRAWSAPRIVGFVGQSRGVTAIFQDSAVRYTAPASVGADTIRAVYEVGFGGATVRDTSVFQFEVLQRYTPNGYSVTPIVAPGVVLTGNGLSSDGRIAGTATLPGGVTHAFKWENGAFTDLGAYQGARTVGIGINASGDVAGYAKRADSTSLALVWKADGTIQELETGQPIPIGITDAGVVVIPDRGYWRNGQRIRNAIHAGIALNEAGDVVADDPFYFTGYGGIAVLFASGATIPFVTGSPHGAWAYAINDSSDVLATFNENHYPPGQIPFTRVYLRTSAYALTKGIEFKRVYPETAPAGASGLRTQSWLKLDTRRNLLETDVLVTTRGAFLIDAYVDRPWQLVNAITMNELGQILGAGSNSSTGVSTPILLTPR